MSDLADAGKAIVNLAKLLEPIIKAAPQLETVGNLENYQTKLKSNIEDLNKKEIETNNRITNSLIELNQAKTEHQANVAKSKNTLDQYRAAADKYNEGRKLEADQLIADANSEKSKILLAANNEAASIVDKVNDTIKNQNKEIEANNLKLASINKDIDARNKVLNEINKKLDDLRAN